MTKKINIGNEPPKKKKVVSISFHIATWRPRVSGRVSLKIYTEFLTVCRDKIVNCEIATSYQWACRAPGQMFWKTVFDMLDFVWKISIRNSMERCVIHVGTLNYPKSFSHFFYHSIHKKTQRPTTGYMLWM